MAKSTPMTMKAAARIKAAQAPRTGGKTPKGSFPARGNPQRPSNPTNDIVAWQDGGGILRSLEATI